MRAFDDVEQIAAQRWRAESVPRPRLARAARRAGRATAPLVARAPRGGERPVSSTPTSSGSCARARSGWSAADLPLVDEARALLLGRPDSLRPRHRRREPGPDADAAADDRAAHDGLVHASRRRRPGDGARRVRALGRPARAPARAGRRRCSRSCATRTAFLARSWRWRSLSSRTIAPGTRAAARLSRRRRAAALRPRGPAHSRPRSTRQRVSPAPRTACSRSSRPHVARGDSRRPGGSSTTRAYPC